MSESPQPALAVTSSPAHATREYVQPAGRLTRRFQLLLSLSAALVPVLRPLWLATMRIRVLRPAIRRDLIESGRAFVGVVWHQYFLYAIELVGDRKVLFMSSRSKDGEMSTRLLRRMGHGVVRGSSSAGGSAALREMTRFLTDGFAAVMVPDGPRGPARVSKPGCVMAARDAGVPLVPFGCAVSPAFRLSNWDRSAIPLPFCKLVLGYGDPIDVPRDASREELEAVRARLDREMARIEKACEQAL
jgi:lysophospholipid acyltransferase (LPLAT)-like uncharacterized protein